MMELICMTEKLGMIWCCWTGRLPQVSSLISSNCLYKLPRFYGIHVRLLYFNGIYRCKICRACISRLWPLRPVSFRRICSLKLDCSFGKQGVILRVQHLYPGYIPEACHVLWGQNHNPHFQRTTPRFTVHGVSRCLNILERRMHVKMWHIILTAISLWIFVYHLLNLHFVGKKWVTHSTEGAKY